ncbi:Re/Si-specific NAD(P)(+) transhydrogenase subunit alpha [Candidatus Marinimicrobia bacterium]|nr:Re/Si-specific NAD(P)(+) transhydrogenase subunit alpha [Candidatus Neomarinimicrobiota bacterium]
MKIGVLKENKSGEKRVAIIPSTVSSLTKKGYSFFIEKNAGQASNYSDDLYVEAGAKIVEKGEVFDCNIIAKVNSPIKDEINFLKEDCLLISLFQTIKDIDLVKDLQKTKCSAFSLNLLPRTTLAQKMDILSSQANIAGYKAVLIGANHIGKYMPLLMTAAGTISPSRTLVIGAGVAGLQAIATAKRLGAQVEAFDVRPEVKEQVESLGAKFVQVENDSDDGVGSGGYAKETSDAYKLRQQEVMKERISKSDLVITTALIPNRPAPVLIPKEMIEGMKPGSAIMDLASENGGNCELTKPDEIIFHNDVLIDGNTNFPSTMATDASQLFSKNVQAIIEHCHGEDQFKLNKEDEIIDGMLFLENGVVRHEPTKEAM